MENPGLHFLKVALMQLEGEAADDVANIKAMIMDPTIAAFDPEAERPGGVAYAIHKRLHHLAQHRHAIAVARALLAEYENEDGDDN